MSERIMENAVLVKIPRQSSSSTALSGYNNRCSSEPSLLATSKPKSLRRSIVNWIKKGLNAVKQALRGICSFFGDRIMVILAGTMYSVWIVVGVIAIIMGVTILVYIATSCY